MEVAKQLGSLTQDRELQATNECWKRELAYHRDELFIHCPMNTTLLSNHIHAKKQHKLSRFINIFAHIHMHVIIIIRKKGLSVRKLEVIGGVGRSITGIGWLEKSEIGSYKILFSIHI